MSNGMVDEDVVDLKNCICCVLGASVQQMAEKTRGEELAPQEEQLEAKRLEFDDIQWHQDRVLQGALLKHPQTH